ncbi:MAG: hypothetical protein KGZ88_10980 [Methylomicrobium sp.]|nr:hypothetical protein [Methylomicrobium sp.]
MTLFFWASSNRTSHIKFRPSTKTRSPEESKNRRLAECYRLNDALPINYQNEADKYLNSILDISPSMTIPGRGNFWHQ